MPAFSVIERDGNYYGCLDFDNSMIRYAEDRYLNIELILEDETGLKIPKTAVVQEEFFVISAGIPDNRRKQFCVRRSENG